MRIRDCPGSPKVLVPYRDNDLAWFYQFQMEQADDRLYGIFFCFISASRMRQ